MRRKYERYINKEIWKKKQNSWHEHRSRQWHFGWQVIRSSNSRTASQHKVCPSLYMFCLEFFCQKVAMISNVQLCLQYVCSWYRINIAGRATFLLRGLDMILAIVSWNLEYLFCILSNISVIIMYLQKMFTEIKKKIFFQYISKFNKFPGKWHP